MSDINVVPDSSLQVLENFQVKQKKLSEVLALLQVRSYKKKRRFRSSKQISHDIGPLVKEGTEYLNMMRGFAQLAPETRHLDDGINIALTAWKTAQHAEIKAVYDKLKADVERGKAALNGIVILSQLDAMENLTELEILRIRAEQAAKQIEADRLVYLAKKKTFLAKLKALAARGWLDSQPALAARMAAARTAQTEAQALAATDDFAQATGKLRAADLDGISRAADTWTALGDQSPVTYLQDIHAYVTEHIRLAPAQLHAILQECDAAAASFLAAGRPADLGGVANALSTLGEKHADAKRIVAAQQERAGRLEASLRRHEVLLKALDKAVKPDNVSYLEAWGIHAQAMRELTGGRLQECEISESTLAAILQEAWVEQAVADKALWDTIWKGRSASVSTQAKALATPPTDTTPVPPQFGLTVKVGEHDYNALFLASQLGNLIGKIDQGLITFGEANYAAEAMIDTVWPAVQELHTQWAGLTALHATHIEELHAVEATTLEAIKGKLAGDEGPTQDTRDALLQQAASHRSTYWNGAQTIDTEAALITLFNEAKQALTALQQVVAGLEKADMIARHECQALFVEVRGLISTMATPAQAPHTAELIRLTEDYQAAQDVGAVSQVIASLKALRGEVKTALAPAPDPAPSPAVVEGRRALTAAVEQARAGLEAAEKATKKLLGTGSGNKARNLVKDRLDELKEELNILGFKAQSLDSTTLAAATTQALRITTEAARLKSQAAAGAKGGLEASTITGQAMHWKGRLTKAPVSKFGDSRSRGSALVQELDGDIVGMVFRKPHSVIEAAWANWLPRAQKVVRDAQGWVTALNTFETGIRAEVEDQLLQDQRIRVWLLMNEAYHDKVHAEIGAAKKSAQSGIGIEGATTRLQQVKTDLQALLTSADPATDLAQREASAREEESTRVKQKARLQRRRTQIKGQLADIAGGKVSRWFKQKVGAKEALETGAKSIDDILKQAKAAGDSEDFGRAFAMCDSAEKKLVTLKKSTAEPDAADLKALTDLAASWTINVAKLNSELAALESAARSFDDFGDETKDAVAGQIALLRSALPPTVFTHPIAKIVDQNTVLDDVKISREVALGHVRDLKRVIHLDLRVRLLEAPPFGSKITAHKALSDVLFNLERLLLMAVPVS